MGKDGKKPGSLEFGGWENGGQWNSETGESCLEEKDMNFVFLSLR